MPEEDIDFYKIYKLMQKEMRAIKVLKSRL